MSDNCDHNFGTFDDFGVKDDQKVSHNMIVMSKSHILKAKKIAEPPFQSKKIAEKVRKSGRHFWAIWGNFGPFWVIFGPLWIILGHSRAIWGHIGPFWVIFGPLWAILGHFGPFLGHL